jgi:hypothetical protein
MRASYQAPKTIHFSYAASLFCGGFLPFHQNLTTLSRAISDFSSPLRNFFKFPPTHRTRRVGLQALDQALLPEDVTTRGPNRIVVRLVLIEGYLVDRGQARRLLALFPAKAGKDGWVVSFASGTERKPTVRTVHVLRGDGGDVDFLEGVDVGRGVEARSRDNIMRSFNDPFGSARGLFKERVHYVRCILVKGSMRDEHHDLFYGHCDIGNAWVVGIADINDGEYGTSPVLEVGAPSSACCWLLVDPAGDAASSWVVPEETVLLLGGHNEPSGPGKSSRSVKGSAI